MTWRGAANIDAPRFMQLAADQLGLRWHTQSTKMDGVTAATKAAIAALVQQPHRDLSLHLLRQ
jgi:hypothetical protein